MKCHNHRRQFFLYFAENSPEILLEPRTKLHRLFQGRMRQQRLAVSFQILCRAKMLLER